MKVAAVEWQTSVRASAIHALREMSRGAITDGELEESLRPILNQLLHRGELPDQWWSDLFHQADSPNASCSEVILAAEQGLLQVRPQLTEELRLRIRPIQEQWEICGPGLLAAIASNMGIGSVLLDPTVVLVHPVIGGAAIACPDQRKVMFEAVLANVQRELPELLRLGWALAQLMVGTGNEALNPQATIPACLAAGELFDVCPFDRRILQLAMDTWLSRGSDPFRADVIWSWWHETSSQADWSKRIADLNLRIQ